MAQKRMFSMEIIDTDAFLEMPPTSQNLYFHLGMRADDDGFVASPNTIMKTCGSQPDDIKVLLAKRFIIGFESGIIVIKHWNINNYIPKDRYHPTKYADEKAQIELKENRAYTDCIQVVDGLYPQIRLDKTRLDKKEGRFAPPSPEEVQEYLNEIGEERFTGQAFVDFYESKNWMIGKNKMTHWHNAVGTWRARENKKGSSLNRIYKKLQAGNK